MTQKLIGEHAGNHRFTDRDGADANARIVAALGHDFRLGAETIDPSGNYLYSKSYIFNFGLPLKHTGFMTLARGVGASVAGYEQFEHPVQRRVESTLKELAGLTGELPRGAVPDLTVDGTVELERMADVVYVGRPAFGQEQSAVGLFKVDPDGTATRVQAKVGRISVNAVEILSGVAVGDQVVLSDMSAWDAFDRVRLQ